MPQVGAVPLVSTLVVAAMPRAVRFAREHVVTALSAWELDGDVVQVAKLLASELVTNAGAPRGALSYPRRSREELEGGFWV